MRDIHRNPILYYLLIPVLVGLWPLLIWLMYLPSAREGADQDYSLLIEGQTNVIEILTLDPQRTAVPDPNRVSGEFDYGRAVEQAANRCTILPSNKSHTAGNIITVSGKKRQVAQVKLKDVSVVQVANFLSLLQSTWVNLNCEKLKLTKKKGMPDQWDADFNFLYYY